MSESQTTPGSFQTECSVRKVAQRFLVGRRQMKQCKSYIVKVNILMAKDISISAISKKKKQMLNRS